MDGELVSSSELSTLRDKMRHQQQKAAAARRSAARTRKRAQESRAAAERIREDAALRFKRLAEQGAQQRRALREIDTDEPD